MLVPLLSNDRNHESWPQVVSADVSRHSQRLKSDVYVVSGQAKGKTLLPLPVGAEKVDADDDKYVVINMSHDVFQRAYLDNLIKDIT